MPTRIEMTHLDERLSANLSNLEQGDIDNFRRHIDKFFRQSFSCLPGMYSVSVWINMDHGQKYVNLMVYTADTFDQILYKGHMCFSNRRLRDACNELFDLFMMKCVRLFIIKMRDADELSKAVIESIINSPDDEKL